MSYEKGLTSAREAGTLRLQQKGLGKRERKFVDNEIDTALLTGEGIAKKSLIPSREKESESEDGFLTKFFYRLQASNKSLKEQVQEALTQAGADEPEVKGMENVKPRSRDEGGSNPSLDEKASELFKDKQFKNNFDMVLNNNFFWHGKCK